MRLKSRGPLGRHGPRRDSGRPMAAIKSVLGTPSQLPVQRGGERPPGAAPEQAPPAAPPTMACSAPWPHLQWALAAEEARAASLGLRAGHCAQPGDGAAAAAAALQAAAPQPQPQPQAAPPIGLPQQLAVAAQQQAAEQRRRRGCSRCITCVPHLRRHAHSLAALAARARGR